MISRITNLKELNEMIFFTKPSKLLGFHLLDLKQKEHIQ